MDETIVEPHSLTVRRHSLSEMDETGDTKTTWDPRKPDEVEAARATFKALRKKGYLIYYAGKDGERARSMSEFDPDADKLIAVPPVVGG